MPRWFNNLRDKTQELIQGSPKIYNLILAKPNAEYKQALPANCSAVGFQCRTNDEVRYAFSSKRVAKPTLPHMTLRAADCHTINSPHCGIGLQYPPG